MLKKKRICLSGEALGNFAALRENCLRIVHQLTTMRMCGIAPDPFPMKELSL